MGNPLIDLENLEQTNRNNKKNNAVNHNFTAIDSKMELQIHLLFHIGIWWI